MSSNQNNQRNSFNAVGAVASAALIGTGLYFLMKSLGEEERDEPQQAVVVQAASNNSSVKKALSEEGIEVQIVNTGDECRKAVAKLLSNCKNYAMLGFDCESVLDRDSEFGHKQKAVLLQLSDHTHFCALIRLCKLNYIPENLQTLLEDRNILKVGLSPEVDAQKLYIQFGLIVRGYLDLRYVSRKAGYPTEAGLAAMAEKHLNVKMDTAVSKARSQWDQSELSARQVEYATKDVTVAVELFQFFQGERPELNMIKEMQAFKDVPFSRQSE